MPSSSSRTDPGDALKKITASASELDPRPRAIYVAVGGTIDIENSDATTEAGVTVVAGTTLTCQFFKITAIAGATIYGLYDIG